MRRPEEQNENENDAATLMCDAADSQLNGFLESLSCILAC